jgi:hypothetical protein
MRNPMDFTPPEHYRELDRQARYYRKERLVVNILLGVAWVVSVAAALKILFFR